MRRLLILPILIVLLGILTPVVVMAQEIDGSDPRDPNLVYLEIRPALDETEIVGRGAPTQVYIGVFTGYSMPVWSDPVNVNEELYFNICVPDRWDEEHDIVIGVVSALSNANEFGNVYQLDFAWEKVTPNVEVVPVSFHSVSAQRYNLSNLQYYCYRDWFVVDFDAPAIDPIIHDDQLALRLRLGQVGGQYTDLDGELIILHVEVLFPRGDFLGDPPDMGDYITEEEMEEIGIQFGVFNSLFEGGVLYFLGLLLILGFSALAFWRENALLFMLTAGLSIIIGLNWHDEFTTNMGLTISIMLYAYSLVCLGLAFRCIFWRDRLREE